MRGELQLDVFASSLVNLPYKYNLSAKNKLSKSQLRQIKNYMLMSEILLQIFKCILTTIFISICTNEKSRSTVVCIWEYMHVHNEALTSSLLKAALLWRAVHALLEELWQVSAEPCSISPPDSDTALYVTFLKICWYFNFQVNHIVNQVLMLNLVSFFWEGTSSIKQDILMEIEKALIIIKY